MIRQTIGFSGRIVFDTSKPDGTPRKLMNVSLLTSTGFRARTSLEEGLQVAYRDFVASNP